MDYPNLLLEAGIAASEIDDRVNEVWRELTRDPAGFMRKSVRT